MSEKSENFTVGDIRKAIEGMSDDEPVKLDMADPPEDSNFKINGIGNYGGTLMISVLDASLYGDDEPEDDDDDDDDDEPGGGHCMKCGEPLDDTGECDCPEAD